MANHKSTLKRIKTDEKKRILNRYKAKTMRNAVKKLRGLTDKAEATTLLPKVISMLDKNVKSAIIHKNKSGNLKSKLMKKVSSL